MNCENRFKTIVTTHVILIKDKSILLLLRQNTDYANGFYGLVGGTIDGNESIIQATIREAKEEVGITLTPSDLTYACTLHCRSDEGKEVIDLFFTATNWSGEIRNAEPSKCKEVKFFCRENLPVNTIPYVVKGLECAFNHIYYDELGWESQQPKDV